MLWGVAILTMVVGSLLALTQTDVKRMLAYSSIAHAGFILTGVIAFNPDGLAGTMFYLLTYGFSTVGAFAIVSLVRDAEGEATHLSQWRGLGQALAGDGRCVHAVPARARRHPADLGLHGQVRGVPRRHQRRRDARGHRRPGGQRRRGVLLRHGSSC